MELTVGHNQNLFDISIQKNGNVQTVFELALLNKISITDNIEPAQKIEVATSDLIVPELVDYFINRQQKVATGSINTLEIRPAGIGYMIIENDFIVG